MCKKKSHIQIAGPVERGRTVPLSDANALPVMIMFVEEKLKLL